MRIRIIRKPPSTYGNGESDLLLMGRVYNLPHSLASALMLDGYAELYETLTDEEKRERTEQRSPEAWTADDHAPRWTLSENSSEASEASSRPSSKPVPRKAVNGHRRKKP